MSPFVLVGAAAAVFLVLRRRGASPYTALVKPGPPPSLPASSHSGDTRVVDVVGHRPNGQLVTRFRDEAVAALQREVNATLRYCRPRTVLIERSVQAMRSPSIGPPPTDISVDGVYGPRTDAAFAWCQTALRASSLQYGLPQARAVAAMTPLRLSVPGSPGSLNVDAAVLDEAARRITVMRRNLAFGQPAA